MTKCHIILLVICQIDIFLSDFLTKWLNKPIGTDLGEVCLNLIINKNFGGTNYDTSKMEPGIFEKAILIRSF